MSGPQPSKSAMERATLYAAGAMSPEDRAAFEQELDAGDEDLARAVATLDVVTRGLAATVEPVAPSSATRRAILAAAGGGLESAMKSAAERHLEREAKDDEEHGHVWDEWSGDAETGDLFTLKSGEGRWEKTGVEGVLVRRLFVDRAANRMTAMFKMSAGAAYLPHVHGGAEECYVLEGDLHVGDHLVMHAGDYQRAPAGSLHGVQRTEGGCTLLITCALDDEVVEGGSGDS